MKNRLEMHATEVLRLAGKALSNPAPHPVNREYAGLHVRALKELTALSEAATAVEQVAHGWGKLLADDAAVSSAFRSPDAAMYPYRAIAPRILCDFLMFCRAFIKEAFPPAPAKTDGGWETVPTPELADFVRLGGAVHAFLNSITQTSYQFVELDAREFNYDFLRAMQGVMVAAPQSLIATIRGLELGELIQEMTELPDDAKKKVTFLTFENEQFVTRLDAIASKVNLSRERRLKLESIMFFCREVALSGSSLAPHILFGASQTFRKSGGVICEPPAVSFAELRREFCTTCIAAFADILLPALQQVIPRTLVGGVPKALDDQLGAAAVAISQVSNTPFAHYQLALTKAAVEAKVAGAVTCASCKEHMNWDMRHHPTAFCPNCGSTYEVHIVDETDSLASSP